jgi:hypothetical protein
MESDADVHVDFVERAVDDPRGLFAARCKVCEAEPSVLRVRVWRRSPATSGRAWRVRTFHLCDAHRERAGDLV